MSSDNPYNELGQILAEGGEIALGLAIAGGWSSTQIAMLFARRFEPMRPDERDRLIGLANSALSAAAMANNLDDDERLSLAGIPLNPSLFGDDPAGRRLKWVGELLDEDGKPIISIRGDLPDVTSMGELRDIVGDRGREIIGKYPGRFGLQTEDEVDELTVRITFLERRF